MPLNKKTKVTKPKKEHNFIISSPMGAMYIETLCKIMRQSSQCKSQYISHSDHFLKIKNKNTLKMYLVCKKKKRNKIWNLP